MAITLVRVCIVLNGHVHMQFVSSSPLCTVRRLHTEQAGNDTCVVNCLL